MKKTISKAKSIPTLVIIAILVIALIVANFAALKYAPIITTFLGHKSYTVKRRRYRGHRVFQDSVCQ